MHNNQNNSVGQELQQLERRVDDLVSQLDLLRNENRALRARQDTMSTERSTLMHKNEMARARVEAIIGRLKTLETSA
jgi:cell division protein ZapB